MMGRSNWLIVALSALAILVASLGVAFLLSHQYASPQRHRGAYTKPAPIADNLNWTSYGGDAGQSRHARIAQITPTNVGHLEQAWIYRTGEIARRGAWAKAGKFQATPILADGSLIFCTPFNRVVALDPATGRERWVFDPQIRIGRKAPNEKFVCRGLAQWRDKIEAEQDCGLRIIMATNDRRIIALDARNGRRCVGFGRDGEVAIPLESAEFEDGELQFGSAPAIAGETIIVGSSSGDNTRVSAPSGVVRAFDARTGAPKWTFDPVPRRPDPVASPTWEGRGAAVTGQANVWGSITVDAERDLVFLPTSSPSPDFFGGFRKGDNLYANSIVALRASTGQVVWHFQTVHHDLWDYDVPAGPTLITFRSKPALVFATKTGFLFVLDRQTGKPLTRVEERPAPTSDVPGEWTSPTQPHSVDLPLLVPQAQGKESAFGLLGFDWLACRRALASAARSGRLFTPPSREGTLMSPFSGGGANWGGLAVDPSSNRIFINTNRGVHKVTLIPAAEAARRKPLEPGREISLMLGAPYGMIREPVLSPLGMPCNQPPWGALAAVDLETGRLAWERPLGTTKGLAPFGLAFPFGTPNFGGPIHTEGNLVFIAAAMDNFLRAFDAKTGQELWAGPLPNGGQATPMTYAISGRQYVVVVAGGHPSLGNPIGESVVAFALPR